MTRTMNTPWAPPFSFHWSRVVLNVTCVGPEPPPVELQTNPAGTLETPVPTTVNPADTLSAMQPIDWMPSVTVTVTSVATPSVRTVGERSTDQGVAALIAAGFPGTAVAANPTSASARDRAVLRAAIMRPGDPAA
jgi:hypothetical protein